MKVRMAEHNIFRSPGDSRIYPQVSAWPIQQPAVRICGRWFDASSASEGIEDDAFGNAHDWLRLKVFHVFAGATGDAHHAA
jgi:hypothetical protein